MSPRFFNNLFHSGWKLSLLSALAWFLLLPATELCAQAYNFRNYSVEDGLPFVNVSTICQDSKGYLWCGGYGGATCFDGFHFISLHAKEGLPNNFVNSIASDAKNGVWLGTSQGLSSLVDNKIHTYSLKDGLPSTRIRKVVVLKDNTVWVATESGVAYKPEGKGFIVVNAFKSLSINDIAEGSDGNIYITCGKVVYRKDVDGYIQVVTCPYDVKSLLFNGKAELWLGTGRGLFCFNGQKELKNISPDIDAAYLLETKEGVLWVGGNDGLYKQEGDKLESVKIRNELNSNLVGALYQDRERNLWVGTYSGLYRLNNTVFESFSDQDGLQNTFVFGIIKDKSDNLIVGTKDGLYTLLNKRFVRKDKHMGLPDASINVMVRQGDILWFGTNTGLYKYQNSTVSRLGKENGLLSDSVTALMLSRKGVLWIGHHGGVTLWKERSLQHLRPDPGNYSYDINALKEDRSGNVWIGAYQGGLFKYTENGLDNVGARFHLKGNSYMAFEEDQEGRIYIGTFNGIYIIDSNKAYNINESNGLSSDLVYVLLKARNKLWIGTNQGLTCFDTDRWAKERKIVLKTFSREEGFSGVECNSNSTFIDTDQTLWFGTVNGLIHFDPLKLNVTPVSVPITLTKIQVNQKDSMLADKSALAYSNNSLGFEFTGFHFGNPTKIRYRYYLKGFDKDWSAASALSSVNYSNLPPGQYTFLIKASADDNWAGPSTGFTFTILTPWWKTNWARSLFVLLIIAIVVAVFRIRIYQIRRKTKLEMRRRVELSEYRLKALRSQMNPHFIFNSLNSIQNYVIDNEVEPANRYLSKFSKLIRQILNNSDRPYITLREELDCLRLYLELEKMRFEERFNYEIKVDPAIDQDFYDLPAMLLQPYVENAILHGLNPKKEKGFLEVHVTLNENYLICAVKDNGIGRSKSLELKRDNLSHKSLGMKITHTRLQILNELHQSDLSVKVTDLENHTGTKVEVFIPINNDYDKGFNS